MATWICDVCCNEYPESAEPPSRCLICDEPRQYVLPTGQRWSSSDSFAQTHATELRDEEPSLLGIGVTPKAGIGQRALLIAHPDGGILWEGVPLLDDAALAEIARRGGVKAIHISHPHLYGAAATNAKKLGDVPVYVPSVDREFMTHPGEHIRYWNGDRLELADGVTVHRTGGHFEGSSVLHWQGGADGRGVLLTGDTMLVTPDRDWVSFMYSVPNLVPLDATRVRRIAEVADSLAFDRLYAGWWDAMIATGAKDKVSASAERYLNALTGLYPAAS